MLSHHWIHWIVADQVAQRVVSLLDFSMPTAAALPGVIDKHSSLLKLFPPPKVLLPINSGGLGGYS